MRNLLLIVFFLGIVQTSQAQQKQNGVSIVEKKDTKRHYIYAKNEADSPRSVFLKVSATGYRRRADRPTIKMVPPKSEVLMLTLIPLRDTISEYTYIFVANTEAENLGIIREKNPTESMGLNEFIESHDLIFTKSGNNKCDYLITALQEARKKFREVEIENKDWAFDYALQYLKNRGQKLDTIALPMALLKGKVIQPIKDISVFVQNLE